LYLLEWLYLLLEAKVLFEYSENVLDIKLIAYDFRQYLLLLFLLFVLLVLLVFLMLGRRNYHIDLGTPRLGSVSVDESHTYVIS
jgi:hypothetical protein